MKCPECYELDEEIKRLERDYEELELQTEFLKAEIKNLKVRLSDRDYAIKQLKSSAEKVEEGKEKN